MTKFYGLNFVCILSIVMIEMQLSTDAACFIITTQLPRTKTDENISPYWTTFVVFVAPPRKLLTDKGSVKNDLSLFLIGQIN